MWRKVKHQHDFMWEYLKDLAISLLRPATGFLVVLAFTLILLSASIFYFFEKGNNPALGSFFDALYFAVTIVTTVGLGDIHPHTLGGKICAMISMLVGTGIFVSFTAVISAAIMQIEAERKQGRSLE
jgi:voltage-gated potassium channel